MNDIQTIKIEVKYSTTKECTALGWLNPVQTKSGKYPYLYSQSQAVSIHSGALCRSLTLNPSDECLRSMLALYCHVKTHQQ